jgi:hypothetical protein
MPIEIDRTASRDGMVVFAHLKLRLANSDCRTRVTVRIDGGLIHATEGNLLLPPSRTHRLKVTWHR